jgi:putative oxidoreductase
MGFRPPAFWAAVSMAGEAGGGLLLALGFLDPLGSLGIAASILVAMLAVHWPKGPWAAKGSYELPLTNLAVAIAIALTGPGRYSLDAALGTAFPPVYAGALAVLTALAVLIAFLSRSQPATQESNRAHKST